MNREHQVQGMLSQKGRWYTCMAPVMPLSKAARADGAGLGQHGHLQCAVWGWPEQEVNPAVPRALADARQRVEGILSSDSTQFRGKSQMHCQGIFSR